MIALLVSLAMVLANAQGVVAECSMLNKQEVKIGAYEGIEGVCSSNGQSITCVLTESERVKCDGPSGTYTGTYLDTVIRMACGCSTEDLMERRRKRELEIE